MIEQKIISSDADYNKLYSFIENNAYHKVFVVCGNSISLLNSGHFFSKLGKEGITITYFKEFSPNPEYTQIIQGVQQFDRDGYELIVAVGGGSNIDTAKAIKYYSGAATPILAIPTTAGSGAEATRFAVIYKAGEKISVGNDNTLPNYIFFDASSLATLPDYHRMSCMLDALCHSIESIWSINATDESIDYAKKAIRIILDNYTGYICSMESTYQSMLEASYYAGKAINISKTTAAHAMAYKITKKYGVAHGHAVAFCLKELLVFLVNRSKNEAVNINIEKLRKSLEIIQEAFGVSSFDEITTKYQMLIDCSKLTSPAIEAKDVELLVKSVNTERLNNTPVLIDQDILRCLYNRLVEG